MVSIDRLTRRQIDDLFERYGFQVYDHESTEMLRAALRVNVEDGTIPEDEVENVCASN